MSDIESLDYSEDTNHSESSSRSNSPRSDDRPMWNKKSGSPDSASPKRKRRSPIRAPSRSPSPRRRRVSPRRKRSRSPVRRQRSRSRSNGRNRSRSRSPRRSPRSITRRRRSPIDKRRSVSRSQSPRNRRRSRSPAAPKRNYRRQRSRSEEPFDRKAHEEREKEEIWKKRRNRRVDIQGRGEISIWGFSPAQKEIEQTYKLWAEAEEKQAENEKRGQKLKADRQKEKKKEERKRKNLSDDSEISSDDSDSEEELKRRKKSKKSKKSKKAKKEKKSKKEKNEKKKKLEVVKPKLGESSDEWEERAVENIDNNQREGSYSPGPEIPEHIKARNDPSDKYNNTVVSYGKDLLKGEGAGMAAYAARGERIPRRGEIGLSSQEIEQYEKWGYVMSGSRHKAMEATRLRKENQILTAEEKRLLSGVSMEARKKKEDAVTEQFRSLIKNKNMRN